MTIGRWTCGVLVAVGAATSGGSCERDRGGAADPPSGRARGAGSIPTPIPPLRDAVGDGNLRVLIAEVAARSACEDIRGNFRGLRAPDDPSLVTGVLWIRGCAIRRVGGSKVVMHLDGDGWEWVHQSKKKLGARFTIEQYVRFAMSADIPGALDLAYAPDSHVLSLWFSPDAVPDVDVRPIGDVDVDTRGAWSTVAGGLATLFRHDPDDLARTQIDAQGTRQMQRQLADGLSTTIDACSGLRRFGPGRPPAGKMRAPDVGESARVPAMLEPSGALFIGPYAAPAGLHVDLQVEAGSVRATLVCEEQAAVLADAFLNDRAPTNVPVLATRDVVAGATATRARLSAKRTSCPVVLVTRSLGDRPARLSWLRPTGEAARSFGGPLIDCPERAHPHPRL